MIDVAIVVFYVAFIVAIGVIKGRNTNTAQCFALGPQNFPSIFLIVIAFSTLVDGNDTIGIAGNTFSTGLLFAAICLGPVISLLLVAFVVAPRMSPFVGMISSGDVMGKLYGEKAKILAGVGVIIEGLVLTAGQVKAIGYVLSQSFGLYEHWGVIAGGIIVLMYSARGGMLSIGITDIVQFGALIIAIPMICGVAVVSVGGFGALFEKIPSSHLTLFPNTDDFLVHLGMFIALALPAIYPGAMQRILMSRTSGQIRSTFFVTANICAAFYIVAAIIGFVALAQNPDGDPQLAMPYVVNSVLPVGVRGLAVAGLLAVITSTVGSHLNMAAVAFSNDIIAPIRGRKFNDQQFISVSKYCAIIVGVLSILLATLFDSVLETVFFVIFWGNPLFFPGMFWGIMGLKASPRAFWIGMASAAATTLFYWSFAPPDFFSSLLSCAVNSTVLIVSRKKEMKPSPAMAFSFKTELDNLSERAVPWISKNLMIDSSKFRRHKSIFLWFIICQMPVSFFFWKTVNTTMCAYFSVLLCTALLSFALLFSEWFEGGEKPKIRLWSVNIFIFFTAHTGMMLAQSYFNYFWLLCTALTVMMMFIPTRDAKLFFALWGFASFATSWLLIELGITTPSDETVPFAVAFYIVSSLVCLIIAWQQDSKFVERIRSMNAAMGHMFSTPLSSIRLKAQNLEKTVEPVVAAYEWAIANGYEGPRVSKVSVSALRTAGPDLRQITDELQGNVKLSLADTPSANEKANVICSVRACLSESLEKFFTIDETRRSLVKLDLQGEIEFLGNRDEFSYVLNDLLKNAFEEITAAGKGELRVRIIEDERVAIIEDTAKGISAKNLRRIFRECFTTKPNGHGIGLHFCKSKMEELGGSIECTSQEGEYARFTLSFPNFDKSAWRSRL